MTGGVLSGLASNIALPSRSLTPSADPGYLYKTYAALGSYNTAKFALSAWIYKNTTDDDTVFAQNSTGGFSFRLGFFSNNRLIFTDSDHFNLQTTDRVDPGAWVQLYLEYDSAQAVASDRIKIYVNGVQPSLSLAIYPAVPINTPSGNFVIGANITNGSITGGNFHGLIYQPAIFSGTLPGSLVVYNGHPRPLNNAPGIISLQNTNATDPIGTDAILVGSPWSYLDIIKSTSIPS